IRGPRGDPVPGGTAGEISIEVVERTDPHGLGGFARSAAEVREQERVRKRAILRMQPRFSVIDIETRRGDPARLERRDEVGVADHGAAAVLTTMAFFGSSSIRRASRKYRVSGISGKWMERKSAPRRSSSASG